MGSQLELDALAVIETAVQEHRPSHVFALFSGGHDSLCSTHLASLHPAFSGVVHINTGIGIEQTREYVRRTCREYGWPLLEYAAPDGEYERQVLTHGFPYGAQAHSIMYRRLKERQLDRLIREHKAGARDRIVLVAGARQQESQRRMGTVQVVRREGATVWVNPIWDWTQADKWTHIEANGLPTNDVVAHLHMSGECLCGAFAKPGELDHLRFFYPETAARIEGIEQRAFAAGVWCRWGRERPDGYALVGEEQPWLPLCQSCPTRWEAA